MNYRRLAGAFALIALVFSFAETARAGACEGTKASAQHQMPGHGAPADHQPMPNCPFSGSQTSCSSTVSMPTTYTVAVMPVLALATSFTGDVVLPHAERTTVIFHPPRY